MDLDDGIQIVGLLHYAVLQRVKVLLKQPLAPKSKDVVVLVLEDVRGYFDILCGMLLSDTIC
jgi:hypothetical protein